MTQHDYNIANSTFPSVRSDLNTALEAIATVNSGSTLPANPFSGQFAINTSTNVLYQTNHANTSWLAIGIVDQTGLILTNAGNPSGLVTPTFEKQLLYNSTGKIS